MQVVTPYIVVPVLPEKLKHLREIAYNLYWCWTDDMLQLFRRMDLELWESTNHNPVLMLGKISQPKLDALAANGSFLAHLERVYERLQTYLTEETWFKKKYSNLNELTIAYFSAEFGISECLPIYSGGLGMLAGDHLKSASELGLPLVGVGLMYQQGYFRQYLNSDGWQQESYVDNDFYNMPVTLIKQNDNKPLIVSIDFPGRKVHVQVWLAQVGRVKLYLLDANIPHNKNADQRITYQLYGGDTETRIQQELILGIGGLKVLQAMGIKPQVCHMNEGHSAFLAIERIRTLMNENGLSSYEAISAVRAGNIFTTHTPVEAGIDNFFPEFMEKYFRDYAASLKISTKELLAKGRLNPDNDLEPFNMAYLAMDLSSYQNGVSRLHGAVSRTMWQKLWPEIPVNEIPISHITNGIHAHSWISSDMMGLYNRYLGPTWREDPADHTVWDNVEQIPPEELWNTHERRRERLIAYSRRRLREQMIRQGAKANDINLSAEILNPNALTIGFARRFATYKRASLLLHNPERLKKILMDKERPIQFIFAGKAHPKDEAGKKLIRQIVHFAKDPELRKKIIFLEDYDMTTARYMVQGVDVWLNNPRRPMEASGTSGMKAAINGVLNLSCLDGWWAEAYELDPAVGWAIGKGEDYVDNDYQDEVEANALYDILEKEVVPEFYTRGSDDLPRQWIQRMKIMLKKLGPVFNTNRMVEEYAVNCYFPALERYNRLAADNYSESKNLAQWKDMVRKNWYEVKVMTVETDVNKEITVGKQIHVDAWIKLGSVLQSHDVIVELYYGMLDEKRQIAGGSIQKMYTQSATPQDGLYHYAGDISCSESGYQGFTVRILPLHANIVSPYEMRLIRWQ